MSTSKILPRMKRELEILERDTAPGIICYPVDDNLLNFAAEIKGPVDTPYEGGVFKVKVQIPQRYPMEPPKMQFVTPIYHPNVDDVGRICLDVLKIPPKGSWSPSLNISTTLTSLSVLMSDPNPDDPLSIDIAREFKDSPILFRQKAREATYNLVDNNNSREEIPVNSSQVDAQSVVTEEESFDVKKKKLSLSKAKTENNTITIDQTNEKMQQVTESSSRLEVIEDNNNSQINNVTRRDANLDVPIQTADQSENGTAALPVHETKSITTPADIESDSKNTILISETKSTPTNNTTVTTEKRVPLMEKANVLSLGSLSSSSFSNSTIDQKFEYETNKSEKKRSLLRKRTRNESIEKRMKFNNNV
ncbi:12219_t:CDS:2 [Ambispora leptoticha]|uniref:E2 ubiquitin-conjugating enzyme n=1 Tax=Ambispora leptoticha TaxID=144679 RepID=A0A9N9B6E8_9GLOM|nr:12219_t:CDS:2 [Ambispora leptoticha]